MEQIVKVKGFKNKFLQSCSYIIEGINLILVDPGDSSPLIDYIKYSNKVLGGVILTHCHVDHIYGLGEIISKFPETPIYCSLSTFEGLYNNIQNLSFLFPDYTINISDSLNILVIEDGEYTISGLRVDVLETPGHSDDSLSYIIGEHIFTGDSYIPFIKVFTKWPRSHKELAIKNEIRLKEIIQNKGLNVHAGHWKY